MGQTFYAFVNFFAVPGISDTQCGFKLFRRDCARELFTGLNESGWAFDVEVLYRAQLTGYGIAEVPVNWHEVEGSKVNPVRDAIRMFLAVFRIRRNNAGFLRRPAETGADSLGYAAGATCVLGTCVVRDDREGPHFYVRAADVERARRLGDAAAGDVAQRFGLRRQPGDLPGATAPPGP